MEQHYRLTLKDAIAKYVSGDLTAKGLLHFYILIKCGGRAKDWKVRLEQPKICKELGIAKTAFYGAISRLRAEGSIDWEAPRGILVSISSDFRECGQESASPENESANAESQSADAESESANAEPEFANAENEPPEPPPDKGSGDSPYLLADSYQVFLNSLSEGERENFLKFGLEKVKNLPSPPELPAKWLRKNWQEIAEQWRRSHSPAPPSHDWENDPRRDEWIDKIRSMGQFSFIRESGKRDPDRQAFWDWIKPVQQERIWKDWRPEQ